MTAVLDRPKTKLADVQRLVLPSVSWQTYDMLLHAFEGRHLRITYDRGGLEIMTLSHQHEFFGRMLGRFVFLLALELSIPIHTGGSTTLRKALLERGLEPDDCFWIEHELQMRCKTEFDIETDPPPDLAIEIDITRSWLDRISIYAALGIREVWSYDGELLRVYHLMANGQYKEKRTSLAFPFLPMQELLGFMHQITTSQEIELVRSFQNWVRETLAPKYAAAKSKAEKKNGKRSSK